jgi:hypothetical protein
MLFKNSVRTSKRTPYFTITNINWLMLFKFNDSVGRASLVEMWLQREGSVSKGVSRFNFRALLSLQIA